MRELIDAAGLPERAARRAHEAFRLLAEAEGAHPRHRARAGALPRGRRRSTRSADVVRRRARARGARHRPRRVLAAARASRGFVDAAHGRLPLPAPATLELLRGRAARTASSSDAELVTPTGAALRRRARRATTARSRRMTLETRRLRRRHARPAAAAERRARDRRRAGEPHAAGDDGVADRGQPRRHCSPELVPDAAARVLRGGRARRLDDARADEEGPARASCSRALARPDDERAVAEAIAARDDARSACASRASSGSSSSATAATVAVDGRAACA